MSTKHTLPAGKLNIRFRQMRGVLQVFAGNTYLDGCSGETEEKAISQLQVYYEIPAGTKVVSHAYKHNGSTISL